MKQKIEWYREVLELEPSSKVFFPLARLLAADGQLPEAISTLQQGVRRHPDHLESRLLLIELLFLQHDMTAVHKQIHDLSKVLQKYPTFWTAWSEILSTSPSTQDAALALRFFAMSLQGNSISWATIMQRGMLSVLGETVEDNAFQARNLPAGNARRNARNTPIPVPTESDLGTPPAHEEKELGQKTLVPSQIENADQSIHASSKTDKGSAVSQKSADESPKPYKENIAAIGEDEEEGQEEEFSLRTRSMAEVLAEQGDLAGALEIYQELAEHASLEDRVPLQQRIDELTAHLASANMQPADKKMEDTNKGRNRRLSLYTALEQRLAARGGE